MMRIIVYIALDDENTAKIQSEETEGRMKLKGRPGDRDISKLIQKIIDTISK